ncbi:protein with SET domain flanked by cysteine clusters plus a C-terminal PHD domain [Cryptosporidium ryanae]|uniref:protein with SET domain flanked by cysteine clusters plus a C-terminal PHD domain n=1 Tax=Cryptosporidium ryanae TaxID=515981 RepID=UPI00351A4614|nr:protein with SET domain flanked by cysteine clusters plus a C-terminal PHD domain [Cryptosporidium ryanae]
MSLKNTKNSVETKEFLTFSINGSGVDHKFLSWRIAEFGTGLIPLVSNTVKCTCEKACDNSCLNRLNRYECNKSICGLYDNLHYVYCSNRPFQRLNSKKKIKFTVEKYRPRNEIKRNIRKFNLDVPRISTRLILLESIPKGELIIECQGEILTNIDIRDKYSSYFGLGNSNSDAQLYKNEIKNTPERLFCLVDGYIYLDMTEKGNEARHIRHSCDPNSQAEVWISRPYTSSLKTGVESEFSITWLKMGVFALKNIEKGTEVTIDYENVLTRSIPEQKESIFSYIGMFNCHCNSNKCRKVIGTKKFPKERELNSYLIPISKEEKKRNSLEHYLTNENNTLNKNSFESYIKIKEKLTENQKRWSEYYKKKRIGNISHKFLNIFEYDINKMIEIQKGIYRIEEVKIGSQKYEVDLPLWYLYILISWKGLPNIEECCNKYLPHNNIYKKYSLRYDKIKNCYNLFSQRKSERIRKSYSKDTPIYGICKTGSKSKIESLKFTGKRSMFLHLMTHPWYMALNNHTNIDVELGRLWNLFLSRSIYLGRLYLIQRLSIFFNIHKVHDEDLSWPLIDQGIGDDEKCIVCSLHGTLFSCDICSRGVHKSCLNKCSQFISSPLFRLPDWFSVNDIKRKSYFDELINSLFKKKSREELNLKNLPGNETKCPKITVIYNPSRNAWNSHNFSCKLDNSKAFICHICNNSFHSKFWISLSSRKRRKASINAMKIRISRAYKSHFYGTQSIGNNYQLERRTSTKETGKDSIKVKPQKNNQIRVAKIMINNLFVWRRDNSKFRVDQNVLFSELSMNYFRRREIDSRWNLREHNSSFKFQDPSLNYESCSEFNRNILTKESLDISVIKLKPLEILDSISFEEYIKINS